ncbi:unnamed protein product [Parnassius apollo]|uniref:(apollo) hypothetical protein n=1 Tax=Parnassius apollo TaxID=110799 RepID=A0A8S3Y0F4_PARAO|nr:unnamed protein product [Parnassius apollo]
MASKSNGLEETDWARAPPPSGPIGGRIARIFYNPDDGSILGRTPKRWGIALVFYTVFYAVLALMFSLCMGGLFLTLDENKPSYILESSLIGANPGVAFRPRPVDGVLLRVSDNGTNTYVTELRQFLTPYENETWFTTKSGCSVEDNYGFPHSPCFFIKLNKIYGWTPEYYDVSELPSDMPSDLVEYITGLQPTEHEQIWVSCGEEKPNATKIEYPWGMGLPGRLYPFRNEPGYNSPLVAVKLTPNESNTTVSIRCRAWAKNIRYNKSLKEASGYTRIQLQIEGSGTEEIEM